jgi:hypothetical protein
VFSWLRRNRRRELIREDRQHLEPRAHRLLKSYLASDDPGKRQYYEVIAGAAAACQPGASDPTAANPQLSRATAEAAIRVVKQRERRAKDGNDYVQTMITDAYATVAVAYRRAAAVYPMDDEMNRLGTAAVHLVTIATSFMTAHCNDIPRSEDRSG